MTENVYLAITAAISFVLVTMFMIAVVRYGFRFEVGWLYFKVRADQPKMDQRVIQREVSKYAETHLAALATMKDRMREYDDNAKAIIAHKIADMEIQNECEDFNKARLLTLSVRFDLLLLNSENHYMKYAETKGALTSYLWSKYLRLCRIYDDYIKDDGLVYYSAYTVLSQWWEFVRPSLTHAAEQKLTFDQQSIPVYSDGEWKKKVKADEALQQQILNTLASVENIHDIIFDRIKENNTHSKDAFLEKSGIVTRTAIEEGK